MMQVGLGFGALLGRFLVDFGTKLGGKLGPSWHQNPKNEGTKTMSKNVMKKLSAAVRKCLQAGGGPYNPTTLQDSRTSPRPS